MRVQEAYQVIRVKIDLTVPARVKVVVAHFMQPVAVYRDSN